MSEVFKVKDQYEALLLAKEFQQNGAYNLFRGQPRNWKVISTLHRYTEKDLPVLREKILRLIEFFNCDSVLQEYCKNPDWFYAVAQNYGHTSKPEHEY